MSFSSWEFSYVIFFIIFLFPVLVFFCSFVWGFLLIGWSYLLVESFNCLFFYLFIFFNFLEYLTSSDPAVGF